MERRTYSHLQTDLPSSWYIDADAVWNVDEWRVFLDTSLDRWAVFVDQWNFRAFVHPDTWSDISSHGPAQLRFEDDFLGGEVHGMKFIVTDAGVYGEAARAAARNAGTDAVASKDLLTQVREGAQGLVVQAASLNATPTPGQTEIFAVRLGRLRQQLETLQAEVAHAAALLDLATTAVVDATSPALTPASA